MITFKTRTAAGKEESFSFTEAMAKALVGYLMRELARVTGEPQECGRWWPCGCVQLPDNTLVGCPELNREMKADGTLIGIGNRVFLAHVAKQVRPPNAIPAKLKVVH